MISCSLVFELTGYLTVSMLNHVQSVTGLTIIMQNVKKENAVVFAVQKAITQTIVQFINRKIKKTTNASIVKMLERNHMVIPATGTNAQLS